MIRIWILGGGLAVLPQAQQNQPKPPAAAPKFEVASIKPCKDHPRDGEEQVDESPGRLRFRCETVDELIRDAYLYVGGTPWRGDPAKGQALRRISLTQMRQVIKGSPAWTTSKRSTIDAKAEDRADKDAMHGPMLQSLLKDRFRLKIHQEMREVPVYALTVAKSGAKLQPFKEGSCTFLDPAKGPPPPRVPGQPAPPPLCRGLHVSGRSGLDVGGTTMAMFCMNISFYTDREVIDKTGSAGLFDLHLDLSFADRARGRGMSNAEPAPGNRAVASDPGSTLEDAVRKLGLKLEPAKTGFEFLVIDHVERPSEN